MLLIQLGLLEMNDMVEMEQGHENHESRCDKYGPKIFLFFLIMAGSILAVTVLSASSNDYSSDQYSGLDLSPSPSVTPEFGHIILGNFSSNFTGEF
jgi:hypothetical protein